MRTSLLPFVPRLSRVVQVGSRTVEGKRLEVTCIARDAARWIGRRAFAIEGGTQMAEPMKAQSNLELMRTLDDSWNAQDWETFEKRHSRDTAVFWPGQAEPTRGRDNHKAESIEFFKTFPDNHLINHPYKVEIAQGDWTCTVADFTGTMRGPMKGSDGKMIAPTNKKFHIEFCTVAHWKNGEIVEEKLFYDLVGLLKQIGVM